MLAHTLRSPEGTTIGDITALSLLVAGIFGLLARAYLVSSPKWVDYLGLAALALAYYRRRPQGVHVLMEKQM
ncbi:hypothetical protein GQ43DRAFT_440787 [Delitschia confertaspora ATCC 74209]|uniref:Uncharacterized protein n=1 Tax=Delitschia confertaspora ATCC 74209 TaxID=1513339 RepID=A0A9P4JRE8_9PLEO|nr:hypothetical protein GQ43DRAFT_440787 [Delitschia confertaspora ATCC 74209]